jgi:hypothetical protein
MARIDVIRERFERSEFEFSRHAVDQTLRRNIGVAEIRQAASRADMIEDYPDDKYGPSCLLLGYTDANRLIHVHCSYPDRSLIKLITVYEPDATLWIDFRIRKPSP